MPRRVDNERPEIVIQKTALGLELDVCQAGQFSDLVRRPVRKLQCVGSWWYLSP
jgi:hypothetical protein